MQTVFFSKTLKAY